MIGTILQKERQARGLSLGKLALSSGVHKGTLSRWESGKNIPSLHELGLVMEALELSASARQVCWQSLEVPRSLHAIRQESVGTGGPVSSGELLRALRVRSGLSQSEAARAAGVTRSLLSQWERNNCWPDGEQLHALCFALGATVEELVFLTARGWNQLEPLPDDKDALDAVVNHLEYHDLSENRGLVYLALAGRYQTLYQQGKLMETEATDVWGRYAYYLCWRLRRYADAARMVTPALGPLKRASLLSRGQVEAVGALMQCHLHQKQGEQARELMLGVEGQLPPVRRSWWLDFTGQVFESAGQPLQAIAYQRDAVQVATSAYEQRLRQGRLTALLCRQGEFREALTTVTPLLRTTHREAQVHVGAPLELYLHTAWALAGLGERTEALTYVERAMPHLAPFTSLPPPLPTIHRLLST